jgi:hypothetical protein
VTVNASYRNSLAEGAARATYDAAITQAAQILVDACYQRDMLAATHGTRAVAEAAWYPGHPLGSIDAIQAAYEARQQQARRHVITAPTAA